MNDVLIVDDEAAMRVALEANFRRRGWKVKTASGVVEALEQFRSAPSTLVVTDMRMPDGDGLQVMQGVRTCMPDTPVILLTAYGSVPDAVQAIKGGACDYLQKPVPFEQLEATAKRFLEAAGGTGGQETAFEGVGISAAFRSLIATAQRVAQTDADILIEAESGTGKELLAKLIHRASSRNEGPFVAVNCSAFPDNLLESELFGHVRGAFTGATAPKPGKFELADGGTLLLDEIGEMPLSLQPKILRVLQEREIDRLGDTRPVPVNVRVIATTNRSLRAQIDAGLFRADLYYRLHVVPLAIPPLRERREDIVPLAEFFVRKYEPREKRGMYQIAPELAEQLKSNDWPGNVRELENFIRRSLALATGTTLGPQILEQETPKQKESAASLKPGVTLQEAERQLLERTLEATGGNRTRAAELMGVSLRTVRNKIREYGLPARRAS
ncbi:MAG TPA: sigma-54 dependent transcriptional regulator [Methylomirabilota bacterium]|nr:sigma-54 dependent transcriptional regulator [Methylomirabilota bacterium]